jgi:multidrug transporter EmrE-like cation transporter
MHWINLHQQYSQMQITEEDLMPKSDRITDGEYAIVVIMACIGASLHGVAMALRKRFGAYHEGFEFWGEWRWWTGAVLDGVAGCLIWPAMPYVPVELFAPLIIVIQLGSSCAIGIGYFKEKTSWYHCVGVICAVVGVTGISLSEPRRAAPFRIDHFWSAWVSGRVLVVDCVAVSLLIGSRAFAQPVTFWAISSSILEGFQYICSRIIMDAMVTLKLNFMTPTVVAAGCMKVCFGLTGLHFQQSGLKSDLSSFAGMFLVGCALFMCVYGTSFFGDELHASGKFSASVSITLAGIWLLNLNEERRVKLGSESEKVSSAAEIQDDDSVYEGAEQMVDGSV